MLPFATLRGLGAPERDDVAFLTWPLPVVMFSLSNGFFFFLQCFFSCLGANVSLCFLLALLIKLGREIKFKSSSLTAYNTAALLKDLVQKEFYGLLI